MAIPDMKELMEKAKEMQQQMQKAQQEITAVTVVGDSGGGAVKVYMNGAHHVIRTDFSPTLVGEDEDLLGKLATDAFNDASKKIEATTREKMIQIAKTMDLPDDLSGSDN
jgi:hypothetical protein